MAVGGGLFVSESRFVIWQGSGRIVWLRELSLSETDTLEQVGVVLEVTSDLLQQGVAAFVDDAVSGHEKLTLCLACVDHAALVHFSAHSGSYVSRCVAEGCVAASSRCVSLVDAFPALARQPTTSARAWYSERVLFIGCRDGCVARLDVAQRKFRMSSRESSSASSLSGLLSLLRSPREPTGPANTEHTIAIAVGGSTVLALRVDGTLTAWTIDTLTHTMSTRLEVAGAALTSESRLAANEKWCVATLCSAGWTKVRRVVVEHPTARVVVSTISDNEIGACSVETELAWAALTDSRGRLTGLETTCLDGGEPMRHALQNAHYQQDDNRLERMVQRFGGWAKAFGELTVGTIEEDATWLENAWARASAAIERFFLLRLATPRRYSQRAVATALESGLPMVLRQPGSGGADDALEACRAWYRIVIAQGDDEMPSFRKKPRGEVLSKRCEALVGCWRQLLELVETEAAVETVPLGFVLGGRCASPPPLVQVGRVSLLAEYRNEHSEDEPSENPLSIVARALARLIASRTADHGTVADKIEEWRLAADDFSVSYLRPSVVVDGLHTLAREYARGIAASDFELASACADALEDIQSGDAEAAARELAEGRRRRHPCGDHSGCSALASGAVVDCAAAHARGGYEVVRDSILASVLADAIGRPPPHTAGRSLAPALEALARRLWIAAWTCSTAAEATGPFPAVTTAVEATNACSVATSATWHVGSAGAELAWACALDGDVGETGPGALARALARCAETGLLHGGKGAAAQEAAAAGKAHADLALAASGLSVNTSEKAWYAAVAHEVTLDEPQVVGLDSGVVARAAFFGRRGADAMAASRVARHLLHSDSDDNRGAYADLEARLFEYAVGPELDDLDAAFEAVVAAVTPNEQRLPRLVRSACERGRFGRLLTLPWPTAEAKAVDGCLERLARRGGPSFFIREDGVDYYSLLYAWRAKRGAWDEAARAMLELATRQDHSSAGTLAAKTALAAQLIAHNALCLLPQRDAFVAARAPVDADKPSSEDQRELRLVSRYDLDRTLMERCARLALKHDDEEDAASNTSSLGDLALALAQRAKHEAALDLVFSQPRTNKTLDSLGLVVASLAKRCVDLDDDDDDETVLSDERPLDLTSHFVTTEGRPYPGWTKPIVAFGSPAKPSWDFLRRIVQDIDSPDLNFCCSKAAVHAILASGSRTHLPSWLVDKFVGSQADFSNCKADPAALVRLYLKFDKLKPACDILANFLRHRDPARHQYCLPYSHVEDILVRTSQRQHDDPSLAIARSRLLAQFKQYLEVVAKDSQLELANRVLATTEAL